MHNACGTDAGAGPWRPRPRSEPMPAPSPKPSLTLRRRFGVDSAVTGLARILQHVFFRETEVTGIERIPRDAPLVFVANHPNSAVAPALLLPPPPARPLPPHNTPLPPHPPLR